MNNPTISKSWNLWDYLYYRTTLLYSRIESKYGFEDNKRRASYTSSLFFCLNIESLVMLILVGLFDKTDLLVNYMGFVFVLIFLIIIIYSTFYFEKKRHQIIFEKYENEDIKQKTIRGRLLILYIASTIISLFLVIYIGRIYWI